MHPSGFHARTSFVTVVSIPPRAKTWTAQPRSFTSGSMLAFIAENAGVSAHVRSRIVFIGGIIPYRCRNAQ